MIILPSHRLIMRNRCGFAGGSMSLRVGFEVSDAHAKLSVSLPVSVDADVELRILLLQYHVGLVPSYFLP